jgi:hypothetical protein
MIDFVCEIFPKTLVAFLDGYRKILYILESSGFKPEGVAFAF